MFTFALCIFSCSFFLHFTGGSTGVVRMTRSRYDFTGRQTRSDFDTLKDLIVNGGLSVTMKNELRSVLRKHYAKGKLNRYFIHLRSLIIVYIIQITMLGIHKWTHARGKLRKLWFR